MQKDKNKKKTLTISSSFTKKFNPSSFGKTSKKSYVVEKKKNVKPPFKSNKNFSSNSAFKGSQNNRLSVPLDGSIIVEEGGALEAQFADFTKYSGTTNIPSIVIMGGDGKGAVKDANGVTTGKNAGYSWYNEHTWTARETTFDANGKPAAGGTRKWYKTEPTISTLDRVEYVNQNLAIETKI